MASELRVNTLKDASGNNSIATSFVASGSAKAWLNCNSSSLTDPASMTGVRDSFNITSMFDNGTGNHDATFTSAMSDADYSVGGTCAHDAPISANRDSNFQCVAESASQININIFSSAQQDRDNVYAQTFGDLA